MSDDEGSKPTKKKTLKKDKYEALIIVLDCGENMKKLERNGLTSFDCAKQAVDWILSRKIFTQSKDHINIVLLGGEDTNNDLNAAHIAVREEYLALVSFEHLKLLQNEIELTENTGNVIDALLVAVDTMKQQTEGDASIENKTILVVSNSESPLKGAEKLEHLKRAIQALDVSLVVMGIDSFSPAPCAQAVSQFIHEIDGTSMSFDEASSALHSFTHKKIAGRAMKKNWEILPGLSLPLSFHMRSTPAKNPLKAVAVNEKGEEVKRDVQYFVKNNHRDEFGEEDEPMETNGKQVEKSELVYGYLFGKSKIVLTEDDMEDYKGHNFNEGEKGGCLKLLQFTQRSNILPSFFIGTNSYTVLPSFDKKNTAKDTKSMQLTLALIESMLQEDTVAICRYAYHASAHLQLMALLPRQDEATGQLYMTAIRLPFMDDWRPFSLPDISLRGPAPSSEKLSAVDELIDAMDLSKSEADHSHVPNPFFQRQCTMMKMKAMEAMRCAETLDLEPSVFLKRGLEPDPALVESQNFKNVTSSLVDIFNLEEIKRIKRTRREYLAQNKDHLKGLDDADLDDEDEDLVKTEIIPIVPDPDGPQKKFWDKVRKALESGGTAINTWTNNVASDMSLFDDSNLAPVEKFKILRAEMLQSGRTEDFNKWLMSLHGNDEYSDFFQFMDNRNEQSLITREEAAGSWYTVAESEMYWSGMLDDEKKD